MAKNSKNPKSKIIAEIREDGQYKKFREIVRNTREKLKVDQDRNEALALHAARLSRQMYGKKQYSPQALLESSLQDSSYRSRMVEIRVQANLHTSLLDDAIDVIKRYITTEFYDELSGYKTVDQRKSMIDRIVASALELKSEGEALVELLDTLVRDIDQTSFQLERMIKALELLSHSKGKLA